MYEHNDLLDAELSKLSKYSGEEKKALLNLSKQNMRNNFISYMKENEKEMQNRMAIYEKNPSIHKEEIKGLESLKKLFQTMQETSEASSASSETQD